MTLARYPRVDIIMPAYNAREFIARAIESVLVQSYENWRLLVIDDGSTDDTSTVLEPYAEEPRIVVRRIEHAGLPAARNAGLAQASGDYLGFLDADDAYLPDHLTKLVAPLEADSSVGGVYSDGLLVMANGAMPIRLSTRRRGPFVGDIYPEVIRASDVFGPPMCIMLRLGLVREMGLAFDERLPFGDDWDFLTRFSQRARFGYVDEPTCRYYVHGDNMTLSMPNARRRASLLQCRLNAIKTERYPTLPVATRSAILYDLLVNLGFDKPEMISEVLEGSAFQDLPSSRRSTLIRLMAERSILHDGSQPHISHLLKQARGLNSRDWKAYAVSIIHRCSPRLCRWMLRLQHTRNETKPISLMDQ